MAHSERKKASSTQRSVLHLLVSRIFSRICHGSSILVTRSLSFFFLFTLSCVYKNVKSLLLLFMLLFVLYSSFFSLCTVHLVCLFHFVHAKVFTSCLLSSLHLHHHIHIRIHIRTLASYSCLSLGIFTHHSSSMLPLCHWFIGIF